MKIIVNATNLRKGGALQVCLSFVYELKSFPENDYFIFLSPAFKDLIDSTDFPNFIKTYFFEYPSRFVIFDKTIQSLNDMEMRISPDCVFTVFGPTYWLPKSNHVMGFANGIHLYKDLPYLKNLSLFNRLKWFILGRYHRFLLRQNTHLYVVETEDVRLRFAKFINVPKEKIKVTHNTFHAVFNEDVKDLRLLPDKESDEFWLISISAFYPHKNLAVIKKIIPLLKNASIRFKFILTLPENEFKTHFEGYSEYIINVGPVYIEQCPYLYSKADALFLPTLVESFTASYPEAMKMKKPILTSDYSFSRSICQNAALYFDPFDPEEICAQILKLANDKALYSDLIENGAKQLNTFPSAYERAKSYLALCKEAGTSNPDIT
jgi:glycosyltransferase involved in cell wall biosynthesis